MPLRRPGDVMSGAISAEAIFQSYRQRRAERLAREARAALASTSTPRPRCSVADCDRPLFAKTMCRNHYERQRRRDRQGLPIGPDQPMPGAELEQRITVLCQTTSCPNQTAGPWRVIGWFSESYQCAKCGHRMVVKPGWPESEPAA